MIHLAARFIQALFARALDADERRRIRGWLGDGPVTDAFFQQPVHDQRHALAAARHVKSRQPERLDLVRAALVHDIGKRHARLGVLGRVAATMAIRLGMRLPTRFALYRDHGRLGAAELGGMEEVVVGFAAHHQSGRRPANLPAADWELLLASDRARWRS